MTTLIRKKSVSQFIKFCVAGGIAVILNYFVFFLLYHFLLVNYTLAYVIGFILSVFLSFSLNRKFAFKENINPTKKTIVKYFLVNIASLLIGAGCLALFVEVLHLNVYISPFFVLAITTTINFTGSKFFVFRKNVEKNGLLKNLEK
jgi:putative flippase GtrA